MDLVEGIRKHGFRKWYERQLLESHAYLVTCFLCMVLVAAAAEQFSFRAPGAVVTIAVVIGGGILGLFSWRRYLAIMAVAETYVDHSRCAQCTAYAKFDVLDWGDPPPVAPSGAQPGRAAGPWLKVRCRKCGNLWTMP